MPNNFPILVGSTTDCAKERRSDYVWETRTSYIGTASEGSSISENVWCITKIVINAIGYVTSTEEFQNVAWTDRYSL